MGRLRTLDGKQIELVANIEFNSNRFDARRLVARQRVTPEHCGKTVIRHPE
jgi:hypothetical protein